MRSQVLALTLSMVSELSDSRVMALLVLRRLPRQGACQATETDPARMLPGKVQLVLGPLFTILIVCLGSLVFYPPPPCQALLQVWLRLPVHK